MHTERHDQFQLVLLRAGKCLYFVLGEVRQPAGGILPTSDRYRIPNDHQLHARRMWDLLLPYGKLTGTMLHNLNGSGAHRLCNRTHNGFVESYRGRQVETRTHL